MIRILAIALLALTFSSCTTVYFDQPQPKKIDELTSFPHELKGWYTMDADTFMIEESYYSFPVTYKNSFALKEIESSDELEIRNGLFYDQTIPYHDGLPYTISNDSLHYEKVIRGSKFLSDSLKLKQFKDYYVLNQLEKKNNYWTVIVITKNGDNLQLKLNGELKSDNDTISADNFESYLSDFTKICNFKELEKNKYLVKPNKKQFDKLVKANLFSVELDMIRINNDTK